MKLLLVEDDEPLARSLVASLRLSGHVVDWVARASQADTALRLETFDAMVLDLNLPDGDGLSRVSAWRGRGLRAPILILSARDTVEDRVRGLDQGADDYLTKPFEVAELEARLRVLVRRTQANGAETRLGIGAVVLDMAARRAELHGQDLALTGREFELLQALTLKQGQVLSREHLTSRLTDFDQTMTANALDILVHRLRKKLEHSGLHLRTLRGFGYQLECPT